jgi:hypothetical protein
MNNLKALALSLALTSILATTAIAGETPAPPCAPIPGQTETPPCSQSLTDGSTDPGEQNGPPSNAVDLTTIVEGIQLALSLF